MNFEEVIRLRCSTRKFKHEKIKKEQLDKILEAGRLAPTARNLQPQKIYVVESEEGLKILNDASPCIYGAQTVLIVCSDKNAASIKDGHSSYEIDASIVATHMLLEATNIGVDNIWVGMFDGDKIKKNLNINEETICLILLGYKDDDCPISPNHNIRKELKELVEYR